MQEKQIFTGVVDALLERERFRIVVPGREINAADREEPIKRTFWDKVLFRKQKYRTVPGEITVIPEQTLIINPCWAGTMYRIADRSQYLSDEIKGVRLSDVGLNLILENLHHLIYIIAAAIENRKEEPAEELQDLIRWNIEVPTIFAAYRAVIDDEEMQSFLNSIVLARGTVKILNPETNPKDGSE